MKRKLSEKKRKKVKKSEKIDLLYINDLPLNSLLNDFLFADDTTLLASGPDLPELIEFVNVEFHKICTYFRQNKLVLHPEKHNLPCSRTVGMHAIVIFLFSLIITTKDLTIPHCASLPTERVQNSSNIPAVKFLGLYFDTELNFEHHNLYHFLSEKSLKIYP